MNTAFTSILIPVDFSINTEIAVKKAVELVDEKGAAIHLLHVLPSIIPMLITDPSFAGGRLANDGTYREAMRKLLQWKECILEKFPDTSVSVHIVKGYTIQQQIAQLARKINPQLIIIGKHNYHNWLVFLNTVSPGKLAGITNCPVLTVKMGSLHNKIKSIVFPVQSTVPNRQIDLLIWLSKRYRARVYLVLPVNTSDNTTKPLYSNFIETYRILKSSLNCPIEHIMVSGSSLNRAALEFAESVQADILLVGPDRLFSVSLINSPQVTDLVRGDSKLEILSVTA